MTQTKRKGTPAIAAEQRRLAVDGIDSVMEEELASVGRGDQDDAVSSSEPLGGEESETLQSSVPQLKGYPLSGIRSRHNC